MFAKRLHTPITPQKITFIFLEKITTFSVKKGTSIESSSTQASITPINSSTGLPMLPWYTYTHVFSQIDCSQTLSQYN